MRHRIKWKQSTLSNTTSRHLLHSDKSTYFYKDKSKATKILYSPSFPLLGSAALFLMISPFICPGLLSDTADHLAASHLAYAADNEVGGSSTTSGPSISMTIINNSSTVADGATVTTTVDEPGQVSYLANTIRINTNSIAKYYVGVQAANDGSSTLIGKNHGQTIGGVGTNVEPKNFPDNTWGYNLTDDTSTSNSKLTYSTLPVYNSISPLQYTSPANPADGNHDLRLTFAAKINANKASDHYQTKTMISIAADAKQVATMQSFASAGTCATMQTNDAVQLIDDRTKSGITEQKIYWVTKLKDGKCWMTQNLDLPLKNGDILKPDDSDVTSNYNISINNKSDYTNYGNFVYTQANASLPSSECGTTLSECSGYFKAYTGTIEDDVQAHYLIGDIYPLSLALVGQTQESGSICPKGWMIPTKAEYETLINGLNKDSIRRSPYYFVPVGHSFTATAGLGSNGDYWSSTTNNYNPSYFSFSYNGLSLSFGSSGGYARSIRCIAK